MESVQIRPKNPMSKSRLQCHRAGLGWSTPLSCDGRSTGTGLAKPCYCQRKPWAAGSEERLVVTAMGRSWRQHRRGRKPKVNPMDRPSREKSMRMVVGDAIAHGVEGSDVVDLAASILKT